MLSEVPDLDSAWPASGDTIFVEINSLAGAGLAREARERLYRMIRGYCRGADFLVDQTDREPHLRRNLVYPIVFSYRHSLELQLKHILVAYGRMANEPADFSSHDLQTLWLRCRRVIEHCEPDAAASDVATIDAVEKCIVEFAKIDPRSFAFRYPFDTDGKLTELPATSLDLQHLRQAMMRVHNFLECVDCQLRYGYDIPF